MFRRILVPVDLTEKNRSAVEAAAEQARASSAPITLLHVIETIQGATYEEFESFYATHRGLTRRVGLRKQVTSVSCQTGRCQKIRHSDLKKIVRLSVVEQSLNNPLAVNRQPGKRTCSKPVLYQRVIV